MSYAQLIINPTAGAGKTAKKWPHIVDLLKSKELDFRYALTENEGHAIEIAGKAVTDGCRLVISVGGDGTINEIVNGIYKANGIKDTLLGIVNTGTGADYIRTVGIPRNYEEACHRIMSSIERTVDLGLIECTNNGHRTKRIFVNFAGLGFDAEIVRATTQKYKSLGDKPSYLMGLLSTLVLYKNIDAALIIDGEVYEKQICTVIMGHGKYGGGGMLTTPDADPSDGLFEVLVIGNLSKPDLLRSLPKIYKGTHLTHPKVSVRRARRVEVRPVQKMFLQADGTLIGEAPAQFTVLPMALNIVT